MKFRFCGDADCPDWILPEINTLSKMSSIKLKSLGQLVVNSILQPPVDLEKAEKLFSDSKLDSKNELKACIACLSFVITSTIRHNCNTTDLHSELQLLGLPREHSTSIKRVIDEKIEDLTTFFKRQFIKINPLDNLTIEVDPNSNIVTVALNVDRTRQDVNMTPFTAASLLKNLKRARTPPLDE